MTESDKHSSLSLYGINYRKKGLFDRHKFLSSTFAILARKVLKSQDVFTLAFFEVKCDLNVACTDNLTKTFYSNQGILKGEVSLYL